ncbi:metallophosphoesterase family protein [Sphingomonas solaris]|uniref:metallophosphoesterase family protein n=1 Tax=Alterirhizorhabdus solaris TaxID=2529389 RepID=UPI001939F961|nr:metallophosphoesterase family protein [Sphingomonas solaris]
MPSRADPIEIPAAARPARVPVGERLYVIGDIHGRFDLFAALIGHIRRDNATRAPAGVRIVVLGDLIDRGPDSAGVVETCRTLAARSAGFVVLKGNHEAMMVDGVRGNFNAFSLWLRHGGDAALQSWGTDPAILEAGASNALVQEARRRIPAETLGWLDALPPSHVAGDYLLVHAGIRPEVPLSGQSAQDMLWIRREFLESGADHPFLVVHGHSITESGVVTRSNRIGIDTGAYRTHVLTALALEDDRRWTLATDASDERTDPVDRDRLEADVAAILRDDEPAQAGAVPGRRRWPRAGVAVLLLASAASLVAAVLLRPPGPAPGVQRYALPEVAAPDSIRIALPPASAAALAPQADRRGSTAAQRSASRADTGEASGKAGADRAPDTRTATPSVIRPAADAGLPVTPVDIALAPDRDGAAKLPSGRTSVATENSQARRGVDPVGLVRPQ